MKGFSFLMVLFGMSSIALGQSSPPVPAPRRAAVKAEERTTPGKASVGPKELPDAKLAITSMAYVETLPGARMTIKNVGGKSSGQGVRLTIKLFANRKNKGAWGDISGNVPWSPYFEPVWCPYDAKGVGTGFLAVGQPTLAGRKNLPALKGGESITLSVKFDELAYTKVNITSLVDFATQNNCRPLNMGATPWSDYKYFVAAGVSDSNQIDIYKGAYLHP